MAIYTKKGDKGLTTLFNSDRKISKSSLEITILGTIDEVNGYLGLAGTFTKEKYLKNKISQVQKSLFILGSVISGAKSTISKSVSRKYEKEIDAWEALMPKLNHFVLPGGGKAAASLNVARTTVRRLERLVVRLKKRIKISPEIFVYLNRLSDYLFTLGRYINFREGIKEKTIMLQ